MAWWETSIVEQMRAKRDYISGERNALYDTSNISSLNTKLDNVLEYYYAAVTNDAPRVDTAVYPGTYKLNAYGNDFYIEKAKTHLYNAISNMEAAIIEEEQKED